MDGQPRMNLLSRSRVSLALDVELGVQPLNIFICRNDCGVQEKLPVPKPAFLSAPSARKGSHVSTSDAENVLRVPFKIAWLGMKITGGKSDVARG